MAANPHSSYFLRNIHSFTSNVPPNTAATNRLASMFHCAWGLTPKLGPVENLNARREMTSFHPKLTDLAMHSWPYL